MLFQGGRETTKQPAHPNRHGSVQVEAGMGGATSVQLGYWTVQGTGSSIPTDGRLSRIGTVGGGGLAGPGGFLQRVGS